MTRIAKILTRVRDTLADHQDQRWDDAQLIRLIHEAQVILVSRTKNLRGKVEIGRLLYTSEHTLPTDSLGISRVLRSDGVPLPLYTHEEMDIRHGAAWETTIGDVVEAVVYDQNNPSVLKLYPISATFDDSAWDFTSAYTQEWNPVEFTSVHGITVDSALVGDTLSSAFGVVTDIDYVSPYFVATDTGCEGYEITTNSEISSDFGILIGLNDAFFSLEATTATSMGVTVGATGYAMSSLYGVAVDTDDHALLVNVDTEVSGLFGVVVAFMPVVDPVTVYYVRRPPEVTTITDKLVIDRVFDVAIKYYVTGMALRDDKDTQNRAIGNEELSFFVDELENIKVKRSHSNTNTISQYTPAYNTGF